MSVDKFDTLLQTDGPVAVTLREDLEPVTGADSVVFPPTFAPAEGSGDPPSYVIDESSNGKIALIDSVGSQANRIEPLFKQKPYSDLVPKATIKIGDREVDLLDAGHRAADAVVRFSDKGEELRAAFLEIREKGSAAPLARIAPTSLVFGVWDSRDTQVKLPRLVGSTIRGYAVEKLTRSAQYFATAEKEEIDGLATQKFLSNAGLDDAPAGRTAGGILARGGIRRDAILNLVALRVLKGSSPEETQKLQRYILGLTLVAIAAPSTGFLREGCLLIPAERQSPKVFLVDRSGKRSNFDLHPNTMLEYAQATAKDFGIGAPWSAVFDKQAVKNAADAAEAKKEKKKKTK